MTFIGTVPVDAAEGETAEIYGNMREAFGEVPNLARAFSHRPGVLTAWLALIDGIRGNMDLRRYELVTLSAARELRSSYCMLAHSRVLMRGIHDADEIRTILDANEGAPLDDTDRAIMAFAAKVVRDATTITEKDVETLRRHGLSDPEIFDVAAAAAARCFFSKTLDALGVQPDASYSELDASLRDALVVGRPIEG